MSKLRAHILRIGLDALILVLRVDETCMSFEKGVYIHKYIIMTKLNYSLCT